MKSAVIQSSRLDLILLKPAVIGALLVGDHNEAGRLLGVDWPADFEVHRGALKMRLGQLEADPEFQPWSMRAMVLREEGVVVGDIGFHSKPGHESLAELAPGGVEFGYGVTAAYRRRGLAAEAIQALMRWAREEHGVERFVASISPDNAPSLALAAKLEFRKIGWHMDEVDGPEDIFERRFIPFFRALAVRPATVSDARAIAAIHVEAWRKAYCGIMPEVVLAALDVTAREKFWRELLAEPHSTLVGESDFGIGGFCSVIPARNGDAGVAEIAAIYVAPASWRQGTGRDLCAAAFRGARKEGYTGMILWVLSANRAAISFYRAQGFAPDGATRAEEISKGVLLEVVRLRRGLP